MLKAAVTCVYTSKIVYIVSTQVILIAATFVFAPRLGNEIQHTVVQQAPAQLTSFYLWQLLNSRTVADREWMKYKNNNWSSSFLNHFQICESTIARKSPDVSIFPFLVFLHFFPVFPLSFLYTIHLVLDLTLGCFPFIFVCRFFFSTISSISYALISSLECNFLFHSPLVPILC